MARPANRLLQLIDPARGRRGQSPTCELGVPVDVPDEVACSLALT